MFCLTKKLLRICNIVVLYDGLCVLHGFVDIQKKGVYGDSLAKKRHKWPCYIYGENIKDDFTNKGVGAVDELFGELGNVPLYEFSMKEEDYVMIRY